MFVDEATIYVCGGRGGDGCVSFRREKYVPKGGPDGGDGGNGGSVYLAASRRVNTLIDLTGKHHWRAEAGRGGSGGNRYGKCGEDLTAVVPTGTLVYDADTSALLKDMVEDGSRICVARGGRGGYGNLHYAGPTNQTPRESTPGTPGRERTLHLRLKLIADVGLVGLPNAGKSTLLSVLSKARPKIAEYPFTTLKPYLGIVELPGFRRLVLADIPGLIEGAHQGAGLGDAFLRHIERTRVIVHLVDIRPPAGAPSPAESYRIIRNELERYSTDLTARPEIVAANKMDLTGADDALAELRRELDAPVLAISGAAGSGLRELAEEMWTATDIARANEAPEQRPPLRFEGVDAEQVQSAADIGDAVESKD